MHFPKKNFSVRKLLLFILLTGCTAPSPEVPETVYTPPPAGAIVAADSFTHTDGLNEFLFKIAVKADSPQGVYTLVANDGPRDAQSQFTLPKNGESLPVFIKTEAPNAFVIGFKMPDDTAFYPYYRVGVLGTTITMQYTNAYKL